ncbi:TPA: acylneuraminate cytidylyltransferase [bacterium]|nr:acylneuraminate cytidylyltransferase [bacterium]
MSVIGIIQARMGSTRLPQKVLMEIEGEPLLGHIITRLKDVKLLGTIIVATSTNPQDEVIAEVAEGYGAKVFRGSEEDVLLRFVDAAKDLGAEIILRATGDNPLIDSEITQGLIARQTESHSDYIGMNGLPLGTAPEIVSKRALFEAHRLLAKESPHREHVTSFIKERKDLFMVEILEAPANLSRPTWRLTVDTHEDLELVRGVFARFRPRKIFFLSEVVEFLDLHPELLAKNYHIQQRTVSGQPRGPF